MGAWESNPGQQDGKCRRIHWAMEVPHHVHVWPILYLFYNCQITVLLASYTTYISSEYLPHQSHKLQLCSKIILVEGTLNPKRGSGSGIDCGVIISEDTSSNPAMSNFYWSPIWMNPISGLAVQWESQSIIKSNWNRKYI